MAVPVVEEQVGRGALRVALQDGRQTVTQGQRHGAELARLRPHNVDHPGHPVDSGPGQRPDLPYPHPTIESPRDDIPLQGWHSRQQTILFLVGQSSGGGSRRLLRPLVVRQRVNRGEVALPCPLEHFASGDALVSERGLADTGQARTDTYSLAVDDLVPALRPLGTPFAEIGVNYRPEARRKMLDLAGQLEEDHPGAAGSIREGLDETLTLSALGVEGSLRRTLYSTNPIESLQGMLKKVARSVKRWNGVRHIFF